MKAPEMAVTMQEFSKEMTKVILKFKVCIFVAFMCQFLFHNFYHPCQQYSCFSVRDVCFVNTLEMTLKY